MNKEQIENLVDFIVLEIPFRDNLIKSITEWLEQNQPKPVVVGLTEKQVKRLVSYIDISSEPLYDDIMTFLETITFTQPEEIVVGLSDEQNYDVVRYVEELEKELEQLKAQQITPDWNDAPENAVCATMKVHYFDSEDAQLGWKTLVQIKRPKPTPKVEVGETWKYKGMHYMVGLMSLLKVGDEWVDCINYISDDNGKCYTRTLSDFLEKFEQVQS